MQTSGAGIRFIQSFEKLRLTPYDDGGGKMTIGWGHLILPSEKFDSITSDQADALFLSDLKQKAENPVNKYVVIAMTQNQFDALVSFCFNVGLGNFHASTLLRMMNMKNFDATAEEFPKWDHEGGVEVEGLYNRRVAEQNIFENGVYNNHM